MKSSERRPAAGRKQTDDDEGSGDSGDDDDDEEGEEEDVAEYERRPRTAEHQPGSKAAKAAEAEKKNKTALGLPVKTFDGEVVFDEAAAAAAARRRKAADVAADVAGVIVEDDWAAEPPLPAQRPQKGAAAKKATAKPGGAARRGQAQEESEDGDEEEEPEASGSDEAYSDDEDVEEGARQQAGQQQRQKQQQQQQRRRSVSPTALLDDLSSFQSRHERRERLKEEIAVACNKLMTAPEQHVGMLRLLNRLAGDEDPVVSRLGMVSAAAVYKDIAPGYRIRLPTEKELQVVVSKDVRALRDYESALLRGYQAFLRTLLSKAQAKPPPQMAAAAPPLPAGAKPPKPSKQAAAATLADSRVAVRCMCLLLSSLPHFNFGVDLLQAIVPRMASGDEAARGMACGAVKSLLEQDVQGTVAVQAVQLVADLVKTRKCVCNPEVRKSTRLRPARLSFVCVTCLYVHTLEELF